MLLLAGIMAVWAWRVESWVPAARVKGFVDDRLLWLRGGGKEQQLATVLEISRDTDAAFGLEAHTGKGTLFGTTRRARAALRPLAEAGYGKIRFDVTFCGVGYHTSRAKRKPIAKKAWDEVDRRLRRIRAAGQSQRDRSEMVRGWCSTR